MYQPTTTTSTIIYSHLYSTPTPTSTYSFTPYSLSPPALPTFPTFPTTRMTSSFSPLTYTAPPDSSDSPLTDTITSAPLQLSPPPLLPPAPSLPPPPSTSEEIPPSSHQGPEAEAPTPTSKPTTYAAAVSTSTTIASPSTTPEVKYWITINEPASIIEGYASSRLGAPGLDGHGVADYQASHTILKAHAKAYRLYDRLFRKAQKGRVSITLNAPWFEPRTNSSENRQAAERARQFYFGYWAHPIYSKTGDYPPVMKQRIMRNSLAEGRFRSRLPEFSPQWVKFIRGTADFFAYNHYTTQYAEPGTAGETPSLQRDSGVITSYDPKWPSSASSWLKVVPWGLRKMLNWVKNEYGNLPVLITENGFSDHGGLHDKGRINYYVSYLQELLKAIYQDKCHVFGYTAWSLIDNFEWARGYTEKFGIYEVNFTDPNRARTPKDSAHVLHKIIKHRAIVPDLLHGETLEPSVVLVT